MTAKRPSAALLIYWLAMKRPFSGRRIGTQARRSKRQRHHRVDPEWRIVASSSQIPMAVTGKAIVIMKKKAGPSAGSAKR